MLAIADNSFVGGILGILNIGMFPRSTLTHSLYTPIYNTPTGRSGGTANSSGYHVIGVIRYYYVSGSKGPKSAPVFFFFFFFRNTFSSFCVFTLFPVPDFRISDFRISGISDFRTAPSLLGK